MGKRQSADRLYREKSDDYRFGEGIVDAVSGVFDGDGAACFLVGDNGDRLTAVAAESEKKSVQLAVIGVDPVNEILFAKFCLCKTHYIHLISLILFLSRLRVCIG